MQTFLHERPLHIIPSPLVLPNISVVAGCIPNLARILGILKSTSSSGVSPDLEVVFVDAIIRDPGFYDQRPPLDSSFNLFKLTPHVRLPLGVSPRFFFGP